MSNYDLAPTDPLSGLHMKGTVTRRFLITYPVPPEILSAAVPPGAELSLHDGLAWVSACFVNITAMRPSVLPEWMGMGFNYLIHRTRARLPYPAGKLRESVLVLEANIDRSILGALARRLTGVQFRVRDITLTEGSESWTVRMTNVGQILYEAEIRKDSIGRDLAPSSRFVSASEADHFLLGVSFGAEWHPDSGGLELLAETHDPWETLVGACDTRHHAYLESVGITAPEADHVITMTDILHNFALRGVKVRCADGDSAETDLGTPELQT